MDPDLSMYRFRSCAVRLMAGVLLVALAQPAWAREAGNGRVQEAQADVEKSSEPPQEPAAADQPPLAPDTSAVQEPAAVPLADPHDVGCGWLGRRVVTVLLRDDLIAAQGFMDIYTRFDCPVPHLGLAFGCSVPAAGLESAEAMENRVAACWSDPTGAAAEEPPRPQPASPPAEATPAPAEQS
ncbi:MAG: hypothetical protein CMM50_10005 [Rhodospirillaceae bacterium]|nr:hypothetical protein [Rhodospirillaceae bacterium]